MVLPWSFCSSHVFIVYFLACFALESSNIFHERNRIIHFFVDIFHFIFHQKVSWCFDVHDLLCKIYFALSWYISHHLVFPWSSVLSCKQSDCIFWYCSVSMSLSWNIFCSVAVIFKFVNHFIWGEWKVFVIHSHIFLVSLTHHFPVSFLYHQKIVAELCPFWFRCCLVIHTFHWICLFSPSPFSRASQILTCSQGIKRGWETLISAGTWLLASFPIFVLWY